MCASAAASVLLLSLVADAATGPVRVLYFDAAGTEQTSVGPLHAAMRDLGRDAIWFDYATGATPDAATLGRYDALALRPKADGQPALNNVIALPSGAMLPVVKVTPETSPEQVRTAVLAVLPAARKASWEKFLAQREPEKREASPTVANYEKRPQPLTFQHPLSVKGSMERTQVPADCRLQLFAAEPDIAKPIFMAWDERGRLDDMVSLMRRCWRTRAYGDFWSYMLLAEGAVDIAAEPELEVYDMAALDIIVREAGGRFTSLEGRDGPWGGNALASNGHLHEAALSFLGSVSNLDDDPDWPRTGPGSVSDLRSHRHRVSDETSDGEGAPE